MPDEHRLSARTTEEVLDDHLSLRCKGDLEGGLARNYDPDVVTISAEGVHHGQQAMRYLAGVLKCYAPEGNYRHHWLRTDGEVGMLRWAAHSESHSVHDGADSYVVRDRRIVVQTIHYSS